MGYRVVDSTDTMRDQYGPRKGLEGPFNFSGRVLYYDNKAGQYYDPATDFYVEQAFRIHSGRSPCIVLKN